MYIYPVDLSYAKRKQDEVDISPGPSNAKGTGDTHLSLRSLLCEEKMG